MQVWGCMEASEVGTQSCDWSAKCSRLCKAHLPHSCRGWEKAVWHRLISSRMERLAIQLRVLCPGLNERVL